MNLRQSLARVSALRNSGLFRQSANNSAYSVAGYVFYPLSVLASTPFLVSRLGLNDYGIWTLVNALTGAMGIFNAGLGDAVIRFVALGRARSDAEGLTCVTRLSLALSLALGAVLVVLTVGLSPVLVQHAFKIQPHDQLKAIRAIQVGGLLLAFRFVDSVFASALRGFERYDLAAKISIAVQTGTIAIAVGLAGFGYGVLAILWGTLGAAVAGVVADAWVCRRLMPGLSFGISVPRARGFLRELVHFWFYGWIQGAAGVLYAQADRLLIAMFLGTAALAAYTVCLQLAQQVQSLLAPAFALLFPWAGRMEKETHSEGFGRVVRWAAALNIASAMLLSLPLFLFGRGILGLWMGRSFGQDHYQLLRILVVGFFLLSLNTVTYYVLLGIGKIRVVAVSTVVGAGAALLSAVPLIHWYGLSGAGVSRIVYSVLTGLIMTAQLVQLCKAGGSWFQRKLAMTEYSSDL